MVYSSWKSSIYTAEFYEMNQTTETVYLNFIKSLVLNVEQLLADIDQNDIFITDETMVVSFRNIGKTLQRIFSKWDRSKTTKEQVEKIPAVQLKRGKNEQSKIISSISLKSQKLNLPLGNPVLDTGDDSSRTPSRPECKPVESLKSTNIVGLIDESFLYTGDESPRQECKPVIMKTEESTKSLSTWTDSNVIDKLKEQMKKAIEDSDGEEDISSTITYCNTNTLKKLKSEENVFYDPDIEKISENTYKCKTCLIKLPKNNVSSHLKGKSHLKCSNVKHKTSAGESSDDFDCLSLDVIKRELTHDPNGTRYIVTRTDDIKSANVESYYYYCQLCKVKIVQCVNNLFQHVTGVQHKRLCAY